MFACLDVGCSGEHMTQSFALRSATGIGLKQQRMSTSATTVFNLGAIVNPYSTNYERERIGNLVFTILN